LRFKILCPVDETVLMTVECPENVELEKFLQAWTGELEEDGQTSWCPLCRGAIAFREEGKCTKRGTFVFHADIVLEDEKGVESLKGPMRKLRELHEEHTKLGRGYPKPRRRKLPKRHKGGVTVDGVHVPPGVQQTVTVNGRTWLVDTTNGSSIREIKEERTR
jgi:hypothetical protein